MFVRDIKRGTDSPGIESFLRDSIEEGLARGFTLETLRAEFEKIAREAGAHEAPRDLLVVHADLNFARIPTAEIEEGTGAAVRWAVAEDALSKVEFQNCLVLTTASGAAAVAQFRSDRRMLIPLKTIDQVMIGVRQPASPFLIAIVSRSESIRKWASLLITALGGSGNDVLRRNPDQPKWLDGLAACDLVVADVLAAAELPKKIRPVALRLVPEAFLEEIRRRVTVEKRNKGGRSKARGGRILALRAALCRGDRPRGGQAEGALPARYRPGSQAFSDPGGTPLLG